MNAWAVKGPDGDIDPYGISDSEGAAWGWVGAVFGLRYDKDQLIAKGYTCVPVQIVEQPAGMVPRDPTQATANESAAKRVQEHIDNGARLLEAADGWKAQAQHFQQQRDAAYRCYLGERDDLGRQVAELQDKLKLAELWRTGYEQAKAENAALREDAERYRWFRSKRLWDADQFPWPVGFEYPEPCLWDEGEMLDAAIDAARKV